MDQPERYKVLQKMVFLLLLGIWACNVPEPEVEAVDRYAHIQDTTARNIIRAAMEQAGGIEQWESIRRLQYTKDYDLLLESGAVETSYRQLHDYQFDPLLIDIRSEENGSTIRTMFRDGHYSRTVNDTLVEVSREALARSVNTATYVVSMPFKLLDPGPVIEYLGADTLSDGRVTDVIQVSYDADANDNHSTSDVWRYYFDRPERRIVANWVDAGDHFALVENLTYERVNGILFNKKRQSFRVDSLGNKLYLRADYTYDNYKLE